MNRPVIKPVIQPVIRQWWQYYQIRDPQTWGTVTSSNDCEVLLMLTRVIPAAAPGEGEYWFRETYQL